jgi:sigma-B regulation protein RsbU (phosphoserine phosphatase)
LLNNQDGLIELIDHLVLVHGYNRIAFIKGPDNQQEAALRYKTYRRALKKHHIAFNPDLVAHGNFVYNTGTEAMRILLEERKVKCDVVVCANDEMALGAYKYLQEKEIRVPQDIALTGFDDIKFARSLNPPLTTVAQPLYEQTRKALEIVTALLKGEKVPDKSYSPTKTIIRQSCGCPPHSMAYVDSVIQYQKLSRQKAFKDLKIDKKKYSRIQSKN